MLKDGAASQAASHLRRRILLRVSGTDNADRPAVSRNVAILEEFACKLSLQV